MAYKDEKEYENKTFVWKNDPDTYGDNNDEDLQALLDDGWDIDFMNETVVKGEKCVTFMILFREKDSD